jgi:tetratricopeptide (TPR) repeat protein
LTKVAQLPAGSARDLSELEVQCARGAVLLALKGFLAAETGKAYSRARDLWDRLGRPPEFVLRMARGKFAFHNFRSELLEAQSVAEDILEFSRAHGDTGGLILGYYTLGLTHLWRGELLSARSNLEEAIGLYDLAVHAQLFQYAGTDLNVGGLASIAYVLLLLGYPDQALMRAEAAIRQARQLAHATDGGAFPGNECQADIDPLGWGAPRTLGAGASRIDPGARVSPLVGASPHL